MNSKLDRVHKAEGIVLRPTKETFTDHGERLSFKVINPEYLLKHDC